jgi:hypothetical protein
MRFVQIFHHEIMRLGVDFQDYRFDGGVAFYQGTFVTTMMTVSESFWAVF